MTVDFDKTFGVLGSDRVWEWEGGRDGEFEDAAEATYRALMDPIDFPPISQAIVSGDRVAVALDPNLPSLFDVVRGILRAIGQTEAESIEIVLTDEACDETLEQLGRVAGGKARLSIHDCTDRSSLRYLAADQAADPIYLNRVLVDADFVLPVASGRPLDLSGRHDVTGVYPSFTDSNSRHRALHHSPIDDRGVAAAEATNVPWLLGVQLTLCVTSGRQGRANRIVAGTAEAMARQLTPTDRLPDKYPPSAALVVAALDGDRQQQTWCNAARAALAASRYANRGGTIVIWSELTEPIQAAGLPSVAARIAVESAEADSGDFQGWDEQAYSLQTLLQIASEFRLLIHSSIDAETLELLGFSPIETPEQLGKLSQEFESCGVLRAAQFAGRTIATPAVREK